MSNGPAASGPRLVYDADAPQSAVESPQSAGSRDPAHKSSGTRRWLMLGIVAMALLAAFEWRRAAVLETRVTELSASLATAHEEIAARREQLGAIRATVEDLRERLSGLASLAAEEPTAASASAPEAASAQ